MKPQTQLTDNDCLRACIASLVHYNIAKVPNFVEAPEIEGQPYPSWWIALQSWLNEMGMFFLEIRLPENFPWQPIPLPALCIFFGTTTRGIKHAIIGRVENDQFLPVFNPHRSAGELETIEGIGFLVPRDPVTHVRMGHNLEKIKQLTNGTLLINPIMSDVNALAKDALQETSIGSKLELNGKG